MASFPAGTKDDGERHPKLPQLFFRPALTAGVAQAALLDRDLDGSGVTDACHNTDLKFI